MDQERDIEHFARLERMEQHLRLLKESDAKKELMLLNIEQALVGSVFNGNKGLTHAVLDLKERIDKTDDDLIVIKENMSQLKWFARGLGGLIFALILWVITKQ